MVKFTKILAVLALAVACVLSAIPAFAANELGVEFTATINTPTLTVSDTAQTVVVTVSANKEVELDGIGTNGQAGGNIVMPDGFSVAGIACGNNNITLEVTNGIITSDSDTGDNYSTTDVLILTYTIPANTPAGSYELGVTGIEITKDYGDVWESNANATVTLTIVEPTPACTHTNKNYVKIDDDTHSVACEDCGEPLVESEGHSYGWNCYCPCGEPITFGVTFYPGDGYFPGDPGVFIYNGKYNDKIREEDVLIPVREGYVFAGWQDSQGKDLDFSTFIITNGFTNFFPKWAEDTPDYSGWIEIADDWFYFDPATGNKVTGIARVSYPAGYAPNVEDVDYAASKGIEFLDAETALFVFGEDGKFRNDFTGILDGKYVKNGQIVWHYGLVEEDGEYYYFIGDAENGGNKLADGIVYLIRTNEIEGFDEGAPYVVEDGIPQYKNYGLIEIDGDYYYIRSNGEKVTGRSYWITNTNGLDVIAQEYVFDENGVMQNPEFTVEGADGIANGYYYVDGKIAYGAGLIELEDGSIIYVRSNGKLATGKYWATNHNDLLPEGAYDFGDDGKLVK